MAAAARWTPHRARRVDRARGRAQPVKSITFTEHLDLEGIRPSNGTVADAYDNALTETVIGLFKTECIRTTVFHHGPYRNLATRLTKSARESLSVPHVGMPA